jgi:hypothetical protein
MHECDNLATFIFVSVRPSDEGSRQNRQARRSAAWEARFAFVKLVGVLGVAEHANRLFGTGDFARPPAPFMLLA